MTRWTILSLLSVSLAFPACSGAAPTEGAPATAGEVGATRAPVAPLAHGKVRRIGDALGQVALRPDQRSAIESLAADAEARQTAGLGARHDLVTTLAAQVASGTIDRDALAPKVDAIVAAMTDAQPKDRAAFETLHAILDPAQRAEFADAMESHGADGKLAGMMKGFAASGIGGPGKQWEDDLNLSAEQRVAFEQILHDAFGGHHGPRGEGHGWHHHGMMHGRALLEAFKADTFSFDEVSPAEDLASKTSTMTTHVLDVVDKVLPLLTTDQRATAAQKITERAADLPLAPGL
jgi:hypothetical protein